MVYGEYTYNWIDFQTPTVYYPYPFATDMAMVVGDFRGRNMTP